MELLKGRIGISTRSNSTAIDREEKGVIHFHFGFGFSFGVYFFISYSSEAYFLIITHWLVGYLDIPSSFFSSFLLNLCYLISFYFYPYHTFVSFHYVS